MLNQKLSFDFDKRKAAVKVVNKVDSEYPILLGSGSTVDLVIEEFAKKYSPQYEFVSASTLTSNKLLKHGFKEIEVDSITESANLVCIDGADQIISIQGLNYCLKGHGGAFVREKLLWSLASKIYVTVDKSKFTDRFTTYIPIEILQSAENEVISRLKENDFRFTDIRLRLDSHHQSLITDNHNLILDLFYDKELTVKNSIELDTQLHQITGTVDTGLFLNEFADKTEIITS